MKIKTENHLERISSPANLIINDNIKKFRKICEQGGCYRPYHHFAFGQSPFPPSQIIIQSLQENSHKHSYLPTAGIPELRSRVAEFYSRKFGLSFNPKQVVISPGSKDMISIILAVLEGNVIIPTPSWVSYLPQAHILKKEVIPIRVSKYDDYKLTVPLLSNSLYNAQSNQKILIFNQPNNPTGVIYTKEELSNIAKFCKKNNIIIISDEIYALTTFETDDFTSMAEVYPEGTIITGGLSKDRSCGGYRLGVGLFPEDSDNIVKDILKIAGSTYSCVSAPIQYAAVTAYSENNEIDNYMDICRTINASVGKAAYKMLNKIPGLEVSNPQGGFYVYINFSHYRENFNNIGIKTCTQFCEDLLAKEHTALLPGESMLLAEDDFSVRFSFVDYDGKTVIENWQKQNPKTETEIENFAKNNCSLIFDGIKYLGRYLEQIKQNKSAVHF